MEKAQERELGLAQGLVSSISGQGRWRVIGSAGQLKYTEQLSDNQPCVRAFVHACACARHLLPQICHLNSSHYRTSGDTLVLQGSSFSIKQPIHVSLKCGVLFFFLALSGHHSSWACLFVSGSRTWQKPSPSRRWWCAEWTPPERTYASWAHQMMPLGFKHSSNSSTLIGLMSVSSSTSGREGACQQLQVKVSFF